MKTQIRARGRLAHKNKENKNNKVEREGTQSSATIIIHNVFNAFTIKHLLALFGWTRARPCVCRWVSFDLFLNTIYSIHEVRPSTIHRCERNEIYIAGMRATIKCRNAANDAAENDSDNNIYVCIYTNRNYIQLCTLASRTRNDSLSIAWLSDASTIGVK